MQIYHVYELWAHKTKPGRGAEVTIVLAIWLTSKTFLEQSQITDSELQ